MKLCDKCHEEAQEHVLLYTDNRFYPNGQAFCEACYEDHLHAAPLHDCYCIECLRKRAV